MLADKYNNSIIVLIIKHGTLLKTPRLVLYYPRSERINVKQSITYIV